VRLLVGDERRLLREQTGVAQDAQHRHHQDVCRGERADEMIATVDARRELREPPLYRLDGPRPFLCLDHVREHNAKAYQLLRKSAAFG
jgi:hypothetical protein